jgi:hypothetical protein
VGSVLFMLLLAPVSQEEAALLWKFKAGETFQQEMRSRVTQTVKIGDHELAQDLIHTTVVKYTVKEVGAGGVVTLEQKIESSKATTPEGNPAAGKSALLNQLAGMTLVARLGPAYQVEQLEGYDELLKRLAGDDPSVRRVVQALLSEEQLKNAIGQSFAFVPGKNVKPGDGWQRELSLTLGPLGRVLVKHSFTFAGLEDHSGRKLAKVTYRPEIIYSPPGPEAANPQMSVVRGTVGLKAGEGVLFFDPAAGRLWRSELKMQLQGELTVKLNGKETPLTFEQTQTVDVRLQEPGERSR